MVWGADQSCGQLALVGKASKSVEFLTLNNSTSFSTLDEFKKAFLERFEKTQSVLEAQHLISNLRQFSDEDIQVSCSRLKSAL